MDTADVIVVGLGATGAATAMTLATRGVRVIGIDAHDPPHTLGSHHGESRIIRKAYYEHPGYVPLLDRAYALWGELASRSGRRLMLATGGLMIGSHETELVSGVLASAREHGLAHEVLDRSTMARRYPMFELADAMVGVHEPDAGILFPEDCVRTFLDAARTAGATLHRGEPVVEWHTGTEGVTVRTDRSQYRASQVVLAAGSGLAALDRTLNRHLAVERQVVVHTTAKAHPEWFRPDRMPIFCLQEDDAQFFYGIPDLGGGMKSGQHHAGAIGPENAVDRAVHARDLDVVRTFLSRRMPQVNGPITNSVVCLYTNTADAHFVADRHPAADPVIVASACSGHGFKFAPVLGEVIADLATGRAPAFDLSMFRASRLATLAPSALMPRPM